MTPVVETIDRELLVVVRIDGRQVTFGQHSIERYYERVKPCLIDVYAAAEDLERTVTTIGEIRSYEPPFKKDAHKPTPRDRPAVAWLWLGEDFAFPLTDCIYKRGAYFAPTCLAKGGCSDELRERRAARRQAESRARAQRRAAQRGSSIARKQTAGHRAPRLRNVDWDQEAA